MLYANVLDVITASIEQHTLLPEQGTVVVGVSGGADSLCLLHLLQRLCGPGKHYPGVSLCAAHLNHQLRGQASEEEAIAVQRLVLSWDLPIITGNTDVQALAVKEHRSIEEAARLARYDFLRSIAPGARIAVAHHQDDQIETLLLHWLRGNGLAGTIGLRPQQQDIIRPLLDVTHADTLAYCAEQAIQPFEDESNNDPRFLRNRIRHELLPLLKQLNPGIYATMLRTSEVMQVDLAWIEIQVDRHWSEVVRSEQEHAIELKLPSLLQLPISLQRHLLRRVTAQLNTGQSPLELRHYHLLERLSTQEMGGETRILHLPAGLRAVRRATSLELRHALSIQEPVLNTDAETVLPIPGCVPVPGTPWLAQTEWVPTTLMEQLRPALVQEDWTTVWRLLPVSAQTVYIDAAMLTGANEAFYVRRRRAGDRIRPLGMRSEKKVQDVFINKHIPREERDRLPLFFIQHHCAWLAGVQLDDRMRLTASTEGIIRLSIKPMGENVHDTTYG